jgi:hypothetical protein
MEEIKTITLEDDILEIEGDEKLVRLKDVEKYVQERIIEEINNLNILIEHKFSMTDSAHDIIMFLKSTAIKLEIELKNKK